MKRILSYLLALIIIMSAAACGSTGKETSTAAPTAGNDNGSTAGNNSESTANAMESTVPEATEAPVDEEKPFIEDQVLYDQNGLKISIRFEDTSYGETGVWVKYENSTEKELLIDEYSAVNEYMLSFADYIRIGPEDDTSHFLELKRDWFAEVGITEETIGQIEFSFIVSEEGEGYGNDVHLFDINDITVRTANYDQMKPAEAYSGIEIYNENGLQVLCEYTDENSNYGNAVILHAENNTGRDIAVAISNVFLNGSWVTPKSGISSVLNGKKLFSINRIESSQMEKNQITSVEEVKVTLRMRDPESNVIFAETEPFSFSVADHAAAAAAFSDPAAFAGFDAFTPEYAELDHLDVTLRLGETTLGEFCSDLSGKLEQLPDALHASVMDAEMIEAGAAAKYRKNETYFLYNPSDQPAAPADCILTGFTFERRGSFANGTYCGFFEGENPADGVTRILGEPYDISFYPNAGHSSHGATVYTWRDATRDHILEMTVEPRETKKGTLEGPFKVKYMNESVIP